MTKNRILGILSLVMAGLFIIITFFTVDSTIRIVGDPGARMFPYMTAFMFAVAGISLIIRKPLQEEKVFLTVTQWKRLFSLFALLCVYIFVIWILGFNIAMFFLLFSVSTMFAKGQNVPLLHRIIYSLIMSVVVYAIFRFGLKIYLPTGIIKIF